MTRDVLFCNVCGCKFWDWLGGKYRGEGQNRIAQAVYSFAQVTWFRLHNNRFYSWLARDFK